MLELLIAASSLLSPMSDSIPPVIQPADTIVVDSLSSLPTEIIRLTDEDYEEVAAELGIEPAAIKAVVDIEAGRAHEGFYLPGKPIINFDLSMFRQYARRNGINLSRYRTSHPTVFARPNSRKHGSYQAAQYARLEHAKSIDRRTALEGTFWGMFQIGGFNWKICGYDSADEFVEAMSRSEREQLEIFARFVKALGYDKYLKAKNWAAFARRYNGPSYARRGYHTRMAAAYRRHKAQETAKVTDSDNEAGKQEQADKAGASDQ